MHSSSLTLLNIKTFPVSTVYIVFQQPYTIEYQNLPRQHCIYCILAALHYWISKPFPSALYILYSSSLTLLNIKTFPSALYILYSSSLILLDIKTFPVSTVHIVFQQPYTIEYQNLSRQHCIYCIPAALHYWISKPSRQHCIYCILAALHYWILKPFPSALYILYSSSLTLLNIKTFPISTVHIVFQQPYTIEYQNLSRQHCIYCIPAALHYWISKPFPSALYILYSSSLTVLNMKTFPVSNVYIAFQQPYTIEYQNLSRQQCIYCIPAALHYWISKPFPSALYILYSSSLTLLNIKPSRQHCTYCIPAAWQYWISKPFPSAMYILHSSSLTLLNIKTFPVSTVYIVFQQPYTIEYQNLSRQHCIYCILAAWHYWISKPFLSAFYILHSSNLTLLNIKTFPVSTVYIVFQQPYTIEYQNLSRQHCIYCILAALHYWISKPFPSALHMLYSSSLTLLNIKTFPVSTVYIVF